MEEPRNIKEYYLFPGNLFAPVEPHRVTTVLGSCVAVCLYDPVRRMGGINHFMLPFWNGEGLASPRYGNIAISKLIEKLLEMGCSKGKLTAKVFGGGEVLKVSNGILNVGERNILLARDMLKQEKIPVIGSDVGGTTGRKIIFNTGSGSILMKRLKNQIDDIRI